MKEVTNFITGTGRCGSTMLSKLLMHHPDALVLREFFASIDHRRFHHGDVSGEGLAALLSGDVSLQNLYLSRGFTIPEVVYRLSESEMNQPGWTKPGILLATLPYITDGPDALYEELLAWARRQPTAPLSVHYPRLFEFLLAKTGRRVCIEASAAGNIDLSIFPNSRFLFVHRSGPETVLSMAEHAHFRLIASFAVDPPSDEELRAAVDRTKLDEEDLIFQRLRDDAPKYLQVHAKMWSTVVANLYRTLQHLPPERYMEVAFEDLLADPKRHMKAIADFFELPDKEGWMDKAAKIIKEVRPRLPELAEEEQRLLNDACYTGQVLTGRVLRADPSQTRQRPITERLFECQGRTPKPLL